MPIRLSEVAAIAVRIPPDDSGPRSRWAAEVGQQILVRARTADGTVGWGGCFAYRSPRQVYKAVEEFVPDVLDRDFMHIADLARVLEQRAEEKREGRWAAAGIELAAWDLLGKQRGVSVHELLREDGRPLRTRIPVYASLPRYERVGDSVCAAEMCMQQGFAAIKLHQVDVASVAAVRNRVGTEVQLMMDVNCAWSIGEAVDMCQQLQPFGLRWLEEPIGPATDYAALSQVRQQAHVPIACGENALNEKSLSSAIGAAAADIYQPSLLKVGGLMAMRRMVNQVAATAFELAPHSYYFGPGLAASVHLAAVCDAITTLEVPMVGLQADISSCPPEIERGMVRVPIGPGLGADPDPATLERYRISLEELSS